MAEKFISDNGAGVHDRIRISTDKKTYEGVLLPRHSFSGSNIVVLKLDNGYNIGVSVEGAELTILSKVKKNKKEFPSNFVRGWWEGIWWSFISMTTVGYGYKSPKSIPARLFSMLL